MSPSCHFRSPGSIVPVRSLYIGCELGKRTKDPTWRFCCVSVQDTGRYIRHISAGPRRLPSRDKSTREKLQRLPMYITGYDVAGRLQPLRDCWTVLPFGNYYLPSLISRCTSIKVRFERVSLPTEWLILGDRSQAADYTNSGMIYVIRPRS
jgi:hypothetical protein